MDTPTILVVGAGPGVGGAVARRFGRAGYAVGLVGRSEDLLESLGSSLQGAGVAAGWCAADVASPEALAAAVRRLADHTGRVDVLHFNPSAFRPRGPLELTASELLDDLAVGVGGLLTAVQAARPSMEAGSRVVVTGSVAADRPSPAAASLGVQKAALRNLVDSLDRALAPDGIRAVSLTVDGIIDRADATSPLHPDAIAAALFEAARQDPEFWCREVRYPTR